MSSTMSIALVVFAIILNVPLIAAADAPHAVGNLARAPLPTAKAQLPRNVFARQARVNTCGYLDGDGAQPFTCDSGQDCVSNTDLSLFGCCATNMAGSPIPSSCPALVSYTSCVDYISAAYCTGSCFESNRVWYVLGNTPSNPHSCRRLIRNAIVRA